MKLKAPVSVQWVAEFIGAKLLGNTTQEVAGLNEIHKVEPGDLSFVDHEKYYNKCLQSAATVILINKEVDFPEGKTLLVHEDPFSAYVKLVKHFHPFIPSSSMISDTANIGEDTIIQPGVFIGNNVQNW